MEAGFVLMSMHEHQRGKTHLGPRMSAMIETVKPSDHLIQGRLKDGGVIYISTGGVPSIYIWPKEGEQWYVRKENNHWRLDTKVDIRNDFTIDQLQPGEGRIAADEIYDANKKHIVAVNDSNAKAYDIINYSSNQWVVHTPSYGAFSDYTDQYGGGGASPGVPNTAAPFKFNTTDESDGISIVSNSRITFARAGVYNIQWSGQFNNSDASDHDVNVWLRKNGASEAVVGSNGVIGIPAKHGSVDGHALAGWNFVFTVAAGDYYEFMWSTNSATTTLQHYAGGTISASPLIPPSTASLVLTVTPVR